jgi:hypothetical protein
VLLGLVLLVEREVVEDGDGVVALGKSSSSFSDCSTSAIALRTSPSC